MGEGHLCMIKIKMYILTKLLCPLCYEVNLKDQVCIKVNVVLMRKNQSRYAWRPIRKRYFEIWIHFQALALQKR